VNRRPDLPEYPARYGRYVDLVPENDICAAMEQQLDTTIACVSRIPESKVDWRYAPGKWTTREVVGHVLDTERIFGFRLLTFGRGDAVTLQRADEELYVRNAEFNRYPIAAWADEFAQVRRSHVTLVRHLPASAWDRIGTLSIGPISVRAMAYVMVGHERHHLRIIRDKYLFDANRTDS
jgi:hypothetical protein